MLWRDEKIEIQVSEDLAEIVDMHAGRVREKKDRNEMLGKDEVRKMVDVHVEMERKYKFMTKRENTRDSRYTCSNREKIKFPKKETVEEIVDIHDSRVGKTDRYRLVSLENRGRRDSRYTCRKREGRMVVDMHG